MVGSSISPPASIRMASSRSSSATRDSSSYSVVGTHAEFVAKIATEAQAQSAAEASPKSMMDANALNDDDPMECKTTTPTAETPRQERDGSVGGGRRKDQSAPPTKLSERINAEKMKTEGPNETPPAQATEQDPDLYQYWSGGSRYEVDNKPWNILGWITEGFKSKLQRK